MVKIFGKRIGKFVINNILLSKFGIRIYNSIYENSSTWLINYMWGVSKAPDFDFNWKIKLLNNSKVSVPVRSSDIKTWEFALSYKWSDKSLTIAEQIVHDFYDKRYVFLDIGANMGLRTLYPLSIKRPVILFEPNFNLKKFTEDLYKKNNFSSYAFENICLSDQNGELDFYISPSSYMSSIYKENAEMDKVQGGVTKITVKTTTLDEYLAANKNIEPKIIKIDTEGNEYFIVKGGEASIKKHLPSLVTEILPNSLNGKEIFHFFNELNYSCYALSDVNNVAQIIKIKDASELNFDIINNYLFVFDEDLNKQIEEKAKYLNQ